MLAGGAWPPHWGSGHELRQTWKVNMWKPLIKKDWKLNVRKSLIKTNWTCECHGWKSRESWICESRWWKSASMAIIYITCTTHWKWTFMESGNLKAWKREGFWLEGWQYRKEFFGLIYSKVLPQVLTIVPGSMRRTAHWQLSQSSSLSWTDS